MIYLQQKNREFEDAVARLTKTIQKDYAEIYENYDTCAYLKK